MRPIDYALLLALAAIWGLSFVFYRVAVPYLGPALFAGARVALAAVATWGLLAARHQARPTFAHVRAHLREYAVVGAFNAAVPYALIGYGELVLPASYATVLNATTPLFTLGLAAGWLGQPVRPLQIGGIALGIGGVAIVVGAAPFPLTFGVALAVIAATGAAASYAIAAVYIRRRLPTAGPWELSFGQLLLASILLTPFSVAQVPWARAAPIAIVSVVTIALLCTVLAYLIYFRILQSAGATSASTVTFLMPAFGVVWGNVLLRERIGTGLVVGFALILVGVAWTTGFTPFRSRAPSTTT